MNSSKYDTSAIAHSGQSKVERYKWNEICGFGKFAMINKHKLHVNHEYQRNLNKEKSLQISRAFDFVAFGCLSVSEIEPDVFEVLDGQHRLFGALRRSDVVDLPCMVYEADTLAKRAESFLKMQTLRKPVTSLDKFKAQVVAGDAVAIKAQNMILSIGRRVDKSKGPKTNGARVLGFIGRVMNSIQIKEESAFSALQICNELFINDYIPERLFIAMFSIDRDLAKVGKSILMTNYKKRILQVGGDAIVLNINRHCALMAQTGESVIKKAAIESLNKGLRHKIFDVSGDSE